MGGKLKKPEDRLVVFCGVRFDRNTVARLELALEKINEKYPRHKPMTKTRMLRKFISEGLDRAGV